MMIFCNHSFHPLRAYFLLLFGIFRLLRCPLASGLSRFLAVVDALFLPARHRGRHNIVCGAQIT